MQNKNTRSVSDFNNELKLKGFNVFQIESDGNATRIYSRNGTCILILHNAKLRNSIFKHKLVKGFLFKCRTTDV